MLTRKVLRPLQRVTVCVGSCDSAGTCDLGLELILIKVGQEYFHTRLTIIMKALGILTESIFDGRLFTVETDRFPLGETLKW